MKNLNLKSILSLLLFCILIGFASCTEDQIIPEQETNLETQLNSGANKPPPFGFQGTQQTSTIYVRWNPKVLATRRDEIRATYSDVNGYMYLVSYTVCPNDPNVEIWQVIFNLINPEDQTSDPLGNLPDEEGEMEKPTYADICSP